MLSQNFTIYSIFFLATALTSFFVALIAWQKKTIKGAKELFYLMIAAGIWSFWIIFETAEITMMEKIFWAKLEYIGAVSTPVFYLLFVLAFTGNSKFITIRNLLLLFTIPAITLLLAITNEHHYLLWSGFSAISAETNIMEYYHGIWFWVGYLAYNYFLIFISTIYLFRFILHRNKIFRSHGLIILFASLCPWIASFIYITGINIVPGLDLTPVSIILSGILLATSILYNRFLDLVPIARETLIENLPDGILVLDGQNTILDINQSAIIFLGIQNKNSIGIHIEFSGATNIQLLNAVIDPIPAEQIEINALEVIKYFKITKKTIKNYADSRLIVINDITKDKKVENELKLSEEKFRTLVANIPGAVYRQRVNIPRLNKNFSEIENAINNAELHAFISNQTTYEYFSDRIEKITGFGAQEFLSNKINYTGLINPEDLEMIALKVEFALMKGKEFDLEYRLKQKDGNWRWISESGKAIYDKNFNIQYIDGVYMDITERKRIELALKNSEEKLRLMLKNSSDVLILANEKAIPIYVSDIDKNASEFAHEDVSGPIFNVVHPDDLNLVLDAWNNVIMNKDEIITVQYRHKFKENQWLEAVVQNFLENPVINAVVINIRNITENKLAELKLKESKERHKEAQSLAKIGHWEIDLNTNHLKWSDEVYRIFGFQPQEFETTLDMFNTFVHPDDKELLNNSYLDHIQNKVPFNFIHRIVLLNGEIKYVNERCKTDYDLNNNPIRSLGSIADISERIFHENEIIKAKEAAEHSKAQIAAILNAMPDITFVLDKEGVFIDYHVPKNEHLFASPEYFIGKNMNEILPKDLSCSLRKVFDNAIETKQVQLFEYSLPMPNGTEYYEARATAYVDEKILCVIRIITESKKAEQKLKELALRNQTLLHTAGDGIHVLDESGNIVEANNSFCKMLGYTNDELMKLNISDWDAKWNKEELIEKVNEFIVNPTVFETSYRRKDGSIYEVEINSAGVNFNGKNYLYAAARDITERKQAEELLKQTRQNYEAFFNTIDELLFVLDTEGNIIHTNSSVLDRLGYTKEELYGQSVLMVHPPERGDEAMRIVGEMLAKKADFCPVPVMKKSGEQIPVETRVSFGIWNGKQVMFGVTKDISDLKLSEEKFSKAFQSNSAAMALSKLDGTFIDVNNTFLKTLNYSRDEIIGKNSKDLNLFVSYESRNVIIKDVKDEKKEINREIEVELRTKDGTIKTGLFSVEKIYIGHELCILTTMVDITYHKESEKIIKHQNKELEKINTDKDRFISILAHDLKSPFNSILGFLNLLSKNLYKYDINKIEKQINIIKTSAQNTYNLLIDILLWVRAQSGKLPYDPQSLNCATICNQAIESLKLSANSKNIVINHFIPNEINAFADKDMLTTIIRNLISNAIKFTNDGGQIDIFGEINSLFVTIKVSDNGIGISEENKMKLWEIAQPFTTIGTNEELGTGLGLLICKEFVEKQGGKIWVESELGNGSTFCFTLNEKQVQ